MVFEVFLIDLSYPVVYSDVRFEDILYIKPNCFCEHVLFKVVVYNIFLENIFYNEDFSDLLLAYKRDDCSYSLFFSPDISINEKDLILRLKNFLDK